MTRGEVPVVPALLALTVSALAQADAVERGRTPTPDTLVRAYNDRDFGAPGWRRVTVDLLNAGRSVRTFEVVNIWRRTPGGTEMLYVLEAPAGLRGTAYLQQEPATGSADLLVHLSLPAGERRVLALGADMLGKGLLGSNFSYDEMRWLLPTRGVRYRDAGTATMLDRPVVRLEARRDGAPAGRWRRAVFYLAADEPFLLGADYFEPKASSAPAKRFRVERAIKVHGVWSAERMRMDEGDEQATVVNLRGYQFGGAALAEDWFLPARLPRLLAALPHVLPGAFDRSAAR